SCLPPFLFFFSVNRTAPTSPYTLSYTTLFRSIRNFKFLGFCYGKNGKGIYIRVHGKSWKKAKEKLRRITSRSRCGSIVQTMEKIKVYMKIGRASCRERG